MADEPALIGDLLPAIAASIQSSHGIHRQVNVNAPKHVILENNLTRKGIWSADASRDPHQAEILFETEDIVGKLVMESSLGRLSTTEMEMVSWIMAQWERQENPDDPWVHCSLKGLADAFGVTWSGSRAAFIKDGLERLRGAIQGRGLEPQGGEAQDRTLRHLVILDVFSRYVVGWMIAHRELATLAERLIADTCVKQGVTRDMLTIHADRGSSMTSKPVAFLMADLGVTKSHSRPHVSNDNPYSESQFKTMKYRPNFPDRFGCIEDGRAFCGGFFDWYNIDHHHSGLGLHTPESVHYGTAAALREQRSIVLEAAYAVHPERFVRIKPQPPLLPTAVWINPPAREAAPIH